MNMEIGIKAEQFLFWEHINGIFVAVQNYTPLPLVGQTSSRERQPTHPAPLQSHPPLQGQFTPTHCSHTQLSHPHPSQEQALHEPHSAFFAPAQQGVLKGQ